MNETAIKEAGRKSAQNAHLLSDKLAEIGIKTENENFYNEFVINLANSDDALKKLKNNGILGGIKLDNNRILVAATEMNTVEEINKYVDTLK